jgi:hypothetical protein
MYSGKYVFSQVLEFVDNYEFNKCVKRYFGNYHVRNLNNEVFALDSTTISVSINLCTWAEGKYSRGA